VRGSTSVADTVYAADLVISGTSSQSNPPVVYGPNTGVWLPFGPLSVIAATSADVPVLLGMGSWQMELLAVGTGADTGPVYANNFAHYEIRASLLSSGTHVTAVHTSTRNSTENGSMVSPAPFGIVTLIDGGSELVVRITPVVSSNWSGYVRLVGTSPYVV
jgi:hypothetical protein